MHIFQYYVVVDQARSTTFNIEANICFNDGEICEILVGPFHSSQDAEKWISSNPHAQASRIAEGEPTNLLVVRAKVEVSLC